MLSCYSHALIQPKHTSRAAQALINAITDNGSCPCRTACSWARLRRRVADEARRIRLALVQVRRAQQRLPQQVR